MVEPAAEDISLPALVPPGWVQTRTGEWIAVEAAEGTQGGESVVPLEDGSLTSEGVGGEYGLNGTTCYLYGYGNAAYGINSQLDNNGLPIPVIAGSAFFDNSSYPQLPQPYFQLAGSWQWPDLLYGGFRPVSTPWQYGVMRDVDESGNLVDEIDSRACYVLGTNIYYLRPYAANNPYSSALAMATHGRYAAGRGRSNNVYRATRWNLWDLNEPPLDLDPANPTRAGFAYGVNASGVTVGKVQRTKDGITVWRAFRWDGSLNELDVPDPSYGVTNYHNVANDVTVSGHAVGASDDVISRGGDTYTRETRAAIWWAGTTNPALLGMVGWTDPNPSRQPGRSEALGAYEIATNRLWVVGTGWLTPTGFSRAYRQGVSYFMTTDPQGQPIITTSAKEMHNLNDAALSVIPSGWTLFTAEDVNDKEWIVGLGTDGSRSRGYVLVPQTEVNP